MAYGAFILLSILAVATADRPYIGLNVPELTISGRIVGGTEAVKGEFPHQVSLQWGLGLSTSHFCGGSIINNQWVLTAGHCVLAVPPYGKFIIKAGKLNLRSIEDTEQTITVTKSIVHEKYKGGVAPYDIALLKLSRPLSLNKNVAAVNLPPANNEPSGTVVLSGWGSISSTGSSVMPNILQTVKLPVVDLITCKQAIEKLTGPSPLHETNVCTGPLTGGFSACSGDSGGPLVSKASTGYEVVGVVSWGIIPCGTPGAPSVYTKVSIFNDWIEKTIANN